MVERLFQIIYGPIHRQRHRLGLIIVVVPMVLLLIYYLLIAVDRYDSESRVVVKRNADAGAILGGISLPFLGVMGSSSNEDAMHLKEFIHSMDMLEKLDKQFQLRENLKLRGLDIVNHLPPWATKEDFFELYRKRVTVDFDEKTGVLVIHAQAHTAEQARKLNAAILTESDAFMNELSQRIAREQVDFANKELLRARKSLDEAKENLLNFQNKSGMLDPVASAEVGNRLIAELEGQLAGKEVEYNTMSAVLQNNAPQLVSLRQTIESLKKQIQAERKKLTSSQNGGINRKAAQYMDYRALVEFHGDVYKISLAAVEKMRLEAARKVKSLAVLSAPTLPEEAEYPRRAYMLGTWLFVLLLLFGLIRLTIEIIEDHRD